MLKEHRRRTAVGRWVAAQKLPQQHLAAETSLLVSTRSPTTVARAPVTSRGEASTLDIKPGQGPVSTKVQSSWGNGRSRAQWVKNLTCFKVPFSS